MTTFEKIQKEISALKNNTDAELDLIINELHEQLSTAFSEKWTKEYLSDYIKSDHDVLVTGCGIEEDSLIWAEIRNIQDSIIGYFGENIMSESKFRTFLIASKNIGGEYHRGYGYGIRYYYHDRFVSSSENESRLAWGLNGDSRAELGDGYRDGAKGNPPRGMHGNIGNLNAQGDLPSDTQMQFRLNSQIKAKFVKKAQSEGLKLTPWVMKTLLKACE